MRLIYTWDTHTLIFSRRHHQTDLAPTRRTDTPCRLRSLSVRRLVAVVGRYWWACKAQDPDQLSAGAAREETHG